MALTTTSTAGVPYVIVSFHGDTNGLATIPVLRAVNSYMTKSAPGARLIFGLDANVYETGVPGKFQSVQEFGDEYAKFGYTSNWGDKPVPNAYTTYNARTYLQPQLNKAVKSKETFKGDVNPKDHILFDKGTWTVKHNRKDNTGRGEYIEDIVFPTLEFPSDHGIIYCEMDEV